MLRRAANKPAAMAAGHEFSHKQFQLACRRVQDREFTRGLWRSIVSIPPPSHTSSKQQCTWLKRAYKHAAVCNGMAAASPPADATNHVVAHLQYVGTQQHEQRKQ